MEGVGQKNNNIKSEILQSFDWPQININDLNQREFLRDRPSLLFLLRRKGR